VDPSSELLDAAQAVLSAEGWDRLTLEGVAERAGTSRVTLWRQGVTRDGLLQGLLERLRRDYRDALWPVLTATGSGRDRLERGLLALCQVIDRHLSLLLASDVVFHEAAEGRPPASLGFNEAFERILADGTADGTLRLDSSIADVSNVVFNTVCWSYVHLRARHGWAAARARPQVVGLVLRGLSAAGA
jgi:AcrR family transcriptional regulator